MKQDIFEVLGRFRNYSPDDSDLCNLETLSTFVNGYETALLQHNIEEAGSSFNRDFSNFLSNKFGVDESGKSWDELLKEANDSNPKKSWMAFFSCLEEFQNTL